MKSNLKNKNFFQFKLHLIFISLLVFIFLILLFFSLGNYGISKNLVINNSFNINKTFNEPINIGYLDIKNKNFIPKRIKLENLILCDLDNYYSSNYYKYYMKNINIRYFDNNLIELYSTYYDISGNSEKKIILRADLNNYNLNYDKIKSNNYSMNLYLFKLDPNKYNSWESCNNKKKEDSLKIIKFNIAH